MRDYLLTINRLAVNNSPGGYPLSASGRQRDTPYSFSLAAFFFPIVTLTAVFGVDLATVAACLRLDVDTVLSNRLVPWVFLGLMPFTLIVGGVLARIVNPPPRA